MLATFAALALLAPSSAAQLPGNATSDAVLDDASNGDSTTGDAAPAPGRLRGRATRVQAYKNGVSLVSLELSGTSDAEGALAFELPDATLLLGGVWIAGERAPRRVEAGAREREVERPCATLRETLEQNVGRQVEVAWRPAGVESERNVSTGRIAQVSGAGTAFTPRGAPLLGEGLLVLVRADRSTLTIPVADVQSIQGEGLRHTVTETEPGAWALELETEPDTAFDCRLEFLARGIQWRAVYRLTGDLDGEDDMTVSYELSNELVDLVDTPVHLIAGEANFALDGTASFLSARRAPESAGRGVPQQQWGQALSSNSIFSNRGTPMPVDDPPAGTARGSSEGDLTRLPIGDVTLARGGRALVRTSTAPAAVDHLYTLDLDVRRGSSNGVEFRDAFGAPDVWEPAYRGAYIDRRRSKAWHRLTVANSGALPWTTGPVLVVRDLADGPFPLAQETLHYTPVGDDAEVPLNLALGVETDFWEESQNSQSVSGRLVVTNRIGEAIALRARIGLGGRVTITEGDATVAASPGRDADWTGEERANWRWRREENPHAEIEWSIELEPGASATLGYRAEFDVRRR